MSAANSAQTLSTLNPLKGIVTSLAHELSRSAHLDLLGGYSLLLLLLQQSLHLGQ